MTEILPETDAPTVSILLITIVLRAQSATFLFRDVFQSEQASIFTRKMFTQTSFKILTQATFTFFSPSPKFLSPSNFIHNF